MTLEKRRILVLLAVISLILTVVFLLSFIGLISGSVTLEASAMVLHGLLFLLIYRDIFDNPDLREEQKHFWSIIAFIGLAAGQLIYLFRRAHLSSTGT